GQGPGPFPLARRRGERVLGRLPRTGRRGAGGGVRGGGPSHGAGQEAGGPPAPGGSGTTRSRPIGAARPGAGGPTGPAGPGGAAPAARAKAERVKEKFPTPAGLGWDKVTIRLISDRTFRAEAGGIGRPYTFADLGCEDRRRKDAPDEVWGLLCLLAARGGELS